MTLPSSAVLEAALTGPASCPAANALTGVTVWSGDYFGAPDVFGIQGSCDPTDTDLAITPGMNPPDINVTSPSGATCGSRLRPRAMRMVRSR